MGRGGKVDDGGGLAMDLFEMRQKLPLLYDTVYFKLYDIVYHALPIIYYVVVGLAQAHTTGNYI